MAFHTITSVSPGISLLRPPSDLGHPRRRRYSSSFLKNSLNISFHFHCTRTRTKIALLEDVEAWRSAFQHYDPRLWFSSMVVVPLLVANWRGSQSSVDSVCIKVSHFTAHLFRLQRRGLGTLLTALILAKAFYSDIAPPNDVDTFENVPQELNSSGGDKPRRIQKPKSRKAETCTQKCLGTCIRGGAGSPGEGPFNIRRPLVVFKEGFRSRQYCLIECSEICNIIGDGDDGP